MSGTVPWEASAVRVHACVGTRTHACEGTRAYVVCTFLRACCARGVWVCAWRVRGVSLRVRVRGRVLACGACMCVSVSLRLWAVLLRNK